MEVPDVLVVTKADLGDAGPARAARPRAGAGGARLARRAGRGGLVAAAADGDRRSWPDALDAPPRATSTWPSVAYAPGAMSALREFVAEHGEGALRALGGRREAERLLAEQDPRASVGELIRALEERS